MNTNKTALIREYARRHYGLDSHELADPKMIVIHFTEIATLSNSIKYFLPDRISDSSDRRRPFGDLNVGIHFFVDRDGAVFSFYPENVIARHIIGFNHCAIGIENIALRKSDLTEAQLLSNARLVKYLAHKYPSIRYLIGHHEYASAGLPHFEWYRELDTNYTLVRKPDPGPEFMKGVRERISDDPVAGQLTN